MPGPDAFRAGDDGETRAGRLARPHALEEELAARWSLTLGARLACEAGAWARAARRADGSEAVLRLGTPGHRALDEAVALRRLAGDGVPAVLASDDDAAALLLERIRPGTRAAPGRAEAVADLLRRLHVAPPDRLPGLGPVVLRRLGAAVARGTATPRKARWARTAVERLEEDAPPAVLVHGALDHRTLLVCSRRGLVSVGLRPCAGDPAYDAGSWVHAARLPGRRARLDAIVAATGLPRERVRDWAAVVGVHG